MKFDLLDSDNFLIYATKMYDNPQSLGITEFNEDLKIFTYIKRLLRKYNREGNIKVRLILNHIVTVNNLFGPLPSTRMLFFYVDEENYSQLKTFLWYLSILPEDIPEANIPEIEFDQEILEELKEI